MTETKIRPQNLALIVNSTELTPSFKGMLWIDSNNILRVDSVGVGNQANFVTVLPEHTITGTHGPKVNIIQTAADNALVISKGGASSAVSISCGTINTGRAIDILSLSSTEAAIYVAQNGNGPGVIINRSGGGLLSEALIVNQAGTGFGLRVYQSSANDAVRIEKSNPGVGPALQVFNTGSGAGVAIDNRGTSVALNINQTVSGTEALQINQAANDEALRINRSNAGGAPTFRIDHAGIGNVMDLYQNNITATASVLRMSNASTIANSLEINQTGSTGIRVNQSAGTGIYVAQNGNGAGLNITKSNTGAAVAIEVYSSSANGSLYINQSGTNNSTALNVNQISTGDANAVNISVGAGARHGIVLSTTGSQTACWIGVHSDQCGLNVYKDSAGAGNCIQIDNAGTGYDARGSGGNWWIDKNGNASFRSVSMGIRVYGGRTMQGWAPGGVGAAGIGAITIPANTFPNGILIMCGCCIGCYMHDNASGASLEFGLRQGAVVKTLTMQPWSVIYGPPYSGLPNLGATPMFNSFGGGTSGGTSSHWTHMSLSTTGIWVKAGVGDFGAGMGGQDWNPAIATTVDFSTYYAGGAGAYCGNRSYWVYGF